jgi:cell volume regulation protein A
LATPSQFTDVAVPAGALAAFLLFLGRPLAVWLCLLPFRFTRNETTFVAWVGLRGAVSILLAILPIVSGLPLGQTYFNVAFLIVLFSLVVQGWTIRPMARWLGLIAPLRLGPLERVELELPGNAHHELVAYRIAADSPIASGERIPRWARPSLIVRDGRSMRLHHAGRLETGDLVYIFMPPQRVHLLDRLFAAPARADDLERGFFGDFPIAPNAKLGSVASTYDFEMKPGDEELTVSEFLKRGFSGGVETGDRLTLGPVDLIVRSVGESGEIEQVGLALEPGRSARPRLPLFQTRNDFVEFLNRRRNRRQARSGGGADGEPAAPPSDRPDQKADRPGQKAEP